MFCGKQKVPSVYRQTVYRREDTEGLLKALHTDGFALIPDVLEPEEVHDLRVAIDGLSPFHWDFTGVVDHYKCVFNRDPFWLRYLDLAGIIDLAEAALGEDCHIIGQTAWRCHRGFNGVGVHADYLVLELPERLLAEAQLELPMQICTVHFFLSDITEDLCPTKVIPGSHKAGRYPQRKGESCWQGREAEPVLCKAGDALFFRSELWHSGSMNRTPNQTRALPSLSTLCSTHGRPKVFAVHCVAVQSRGDRGMYGPAAASTWGSPASGV
jgi:hypothetical protein